MRNVVVTFALGIAMCNAYGADNREPGTKSKGQESSAVGSRQSRMKICDKEANDKNLKGEERNTFVASCMKGGNRTAQ